MAGLAAALNAPTSVDAIAWALAKRGADGSVCRLAGAGGACLDLAIRAAMPAITRVVAAGASDADARPIAALAVDGIASVTALDLAYAERGPTGLVDEGDQPYAVVLADAERDELVLARNGAGPGLYYARLDDGWVVASEPGALVHAGVPAEPDIAVVRRFIQTGLCDESDRTFFAKIRRVLPGETIVLSTAVSGPIRHPARGGGRDADSEADAQRTDAHRDRESGAVSAGDPIWHAGAGGRTAVLVTPGVAGAAVLGAALHQPNRPQPLPAFTATVAGVEGAAAQAPAVLACMPASTIRHTALTATLDVSTLDRFLRDIGEPVPDLGSYLLWTVARELSGDTYTLVDATQGSTTAQERLADRMLAHYGVTIRSPLRGAPVPAAALVSVLNRTLPPQVARFAISDSAREATATEVVLALRDEVAAALVPTRPWAEPAASVSALRRLHAGESADAEALLRAFFVERWLAGLGPHATVEGGEPVDHTRQAAAEAPSAPPRDPDEMVVDGLAWRRTPVRTAPITASDQLLANTAFYVANALTARSELPDGPWFVVVSGKVVAVSQKRVRPVTSVLPGRWARVLAMLARRRRPYLGQPWTMQVAIDHSGLARMIACVLLGREAPAEAEVYPPRPGAMAPADAAVVRPAFAPDDVAASLVAALRSALQREYGQSLAGVAIASADESGCRVFGFAEGPASAAVANPEELLSLVLADNPSGQGAQRTPIVIVSQQPVAPAPMRRSPLVDEDARQPTVSLNRR